MEALTIVSTIVLTLICYHEINVKKFTAKIDDLHKILLRNENDRGNERARDSGQLDKAYALYQDAIENIDRFSEG